MSKSDEDLLIGARERRLPVFDNLNVISKEMSDNLCRMSTGAATGGMMYSDCDETIFTAKNPVLITAVTDVITRADLLDRSLRFVLPPLETVGDEEVIDAKVAEIARAVLGVLLDGVVSALRNLPVTTITDRPAVGFALWGTAAEEGLGLPKGEMHGIISDNIGEVTDLILNPIFRRRSSRLLRLVSRIGHGS